MTLRLPVIAGAAMLSAAANAQQFVQGVPYAIHAGTSCFTFAADVVDQSTGAKVAAEYFAIPLSPGSDPTGKLDPNPAAYIPRLQQAAVVQSAFLSQSTLYFAINLANLPVKQLLCAAPFSGLSYSFLPLAVDIELKNAQ